MVKTLEQFKAAFKAGFSKATPASVTGKAPQVNTKSVEAALKQLKACVEKIEKAGAPIGPFRSVLVELVERFDRAKKGDDRSPEEVAAELQAIQTEAEAKNKEFAAQLKAYGDVVALKQKAAEAVARLEKLENADKIQAEINQAKRNIDAAQGLIDACKFADAAEGLRTVLGDCEQARVRAALLGGGKPRTSDFKALMKIPGKSGGANRLDELVNGLPDEMQQRVFKTAIEARFGAKVGVFETMYKTEYTTNEDGVSVGEEVEREEKEYEKVDLSAPNKSLKRIYQMLTKVPEAHANSKLNPSLKRILHFTQDDGSAAYWDKNKTVYMNVSRGQGIGDDDVTSEIATGIVGTVNMFPEGRDDLYLPKNADVETTFFDWATLHEVGHSVDDLHSFMKGHMGESNFGGWESETLESVAAVGSAEFGCDQAYIERRLSGEEVPADELPPELVNGVDGVKLKQKVDDWCDSIVVGEELWMDGGAAKAATIGSRVYHEAYGDTWVSYEYAARGKGIHGYQFRSEAEWFAELYAAYYSDKLKDGHPAVEFLKKIEEADTARAAKKKKK